MTHDKTIEDLIEQPEHMPIAAMYREAIKAQHRELIKLREVVAEQSQLEVKYKTEMALAREEKRVLREALELTVYDDWKGNYIFN